MRSPVSCWSRPYRLYGRFRVTGVANLPARGAAIVVSNHPSDVDPVFLGVALPRTLHFMADTVQFRRGFVGPVIRRLAAFPVTKGTPDRRAIETALGLLARGEVVALFPEGDLFRQTEVAAFERGVALLAARSGAPVIPVAIVGAEDIWDGRRTHRPWVHLRVGAPVELDGLRHGGAHAYARMTDAVHAAVAQLHDSGEPSGGTSTAGDSDLVSES